VGTEQQGRVLVFFSYAPRDKTLGDKLEDHLSILKYRGLIETWHAYDISAGATIDQQVNTYLNNAHIILLLISANFMAADFWYGRDMQQALERHRRGEASVVPILLKPVLYDGAPFARLTALPSNGKPVIEWRNRDRAFMDIAMGIERTAKRYIAVDKAEQDDRGTRSDPDDEEISEDDEWIRLGPGTNETYEEPLEWREEQRTQKYYQQALDTYERALVLNRADGQAYRGKGNALYGLKRYEEAFESFARAARLDPTSANYLNKGNALAHLQRYDEALKAYDEARQRDPNYAAAYYEMSNVLVQMGRIDEAQQAYEKAQQLGYEE
jgi:tetratricopeptide (TPR) repeat protein